MANESFTKGELQEGKLWFDLQGTTLRVGLTDFALENLGSLENVELPDEGEDFSREEVIAKVEGVSGSLDVLMPARGVIDSVNTTLLEDPDRVTEDPLEEGWLVEIKIQDPSEVQTLPRN